MAQTSSKKTDQAVYVLHAYPFKETSLLVELFSQYEGRISTVAKGARRPRSAMRGMLQAFQPMSATWSGKNDVKTLHGLDWAGALLVLKGEALMCGFYLNELLMRLLPREDAHEDLFDYYRATLLALAQPEAPTATILRQFELKLLQDLGYAVPLQLDAQSSALVPDQWYDYLPERGACPLRERVYGVKVTGQTLLDMANGAFDTKTTQQQSKQMMRLLLQYYLGEKPLHTRQLLIDLQGMGTTS